MGTQRLLHAQSVNLILAKTDGQPMLVGENPEMDPPGQLSQMSPIRFSLHHESMPLTNHIPASTDVDRNTNHSQVCL
jgi:hypothetical protein